MSLRDTARVGRKKRLLLIQTSSVGKSVRDILINLNGEYQLTTIETTSKGDVDSLIIPDTFNTVIVVAQHPDDGEVWRDVLNVAKSRDPYVELILVIPHDNEEKPNIEREIDGLEVMQGGYYAYFRRSYNPEVLKIYIRAANDRINNRRKDRNVTSAELNRHANKVASAATAVLDQLKTFVKYDRATISLLSERGYIDEVYGVGRNVRTLLAKSGYEHVKWEILNPIKGDNLMKRILGGHVKQHVFTNPRDELSHLGWDADESPDIRSWIVLPLEYLNKTVGIITLDAIGKNSFSYADVNEITLQQFANQAALTILSAQQAEIAERLKGALTAVAEQTEQETILYTIAKEACELVDGLYSYVVLPNVSEDMLEFRSAYSKSTEIGARLKDKVTFPIPKRIEDMRKGQGITVLAYLTKEEIILDDCERLFKGASSLVGHLPQAYEVYLPFKMSDDTDLVTRSDIAIPIIDNTAARNPPRVLGVINIEHQNPCAFTQIQIEALKEFARFAAIAIKTHNAKQRIQRLFAAGNEAANPDSYSLKRLANKAQLVSGADGGVKIFEMVRDKIVLRDSSDDISSDIDTQHSRQNLVVTSRGERGHTWRLIIEARKNTTEKLVIPNVSEYKPQDYHGITIKQETIDAKDQALVCLPLHLGNSVIGAMWLHYKQPQQFSDEELEELQLYANFAANAVRHNAQMKLLTISEEINNGTDEQAIAQELVAFVKERFNTLGVIFYVDEPRNKQLRLFAASRDDDGTEHMPRGKVVKYGHGVAGHHYQGIDADDIEYSRRAIAIPNYLKLPQSHQIQADAASGKLKSLYSIRLELPNNRHEPAKKIGILILNDELGRSYKESQEELERFAKLATSLLALRQFSTPSRFEKILSFLAWGGGILGVLVLIASSTFFAPIFEDASASFDQRTLAFLMITIPNFILVLLGGIKLLERRFD